MKTDYPIPIEWSDREWAEIEKARQWSVARRMMRRAWRPEWDGRGDKSQAEMVRRIYRELTGEQDGTQGAKAQ